MKKLIVFLFILLFSNIAVAGGLNASFEKSRFDCPNDPSVLACYKGVVDGSNNLIDFTGNLLTYRTDFTYWTEGGTCSVTADVYRNPVDGTLDADLLDNTGGISIDSRTIVTVDLGDLTGREFTGSFWIRADVPHVCSIGIWEGGGIGWVGGLKSVFVTRWISSPTVGYWLTPLSNWLPIASPNNVMVNQRLAFSSAIRAFSGIASAPIRVHTP